ncbi:UvrD-helicase domain-containing protein [Azotobacter beijerinckii]|uniref:DNA 3'-5' helicase n=1 Tax=Azotobacter beijerinckii TaxID=170623 RepID=A0A1I4HAR9_9GAMM|nr:UvrD-helicase domain-containing protein [Azotobacter beijerinckii]SFL39255.1 Superfamily I DNA or RNA helicase [Azotobacter beijerinckii]
MNPFDRARRKALEVRSQLLTHCAGNCPSSSELVDAIEDVVELAIEPLPAGHFELGTGEAALKRSINTIYIRRDVSGSERAYLLAHELGHWFLDFVEAQKTISQLALLNPSNAGPGATVVEGYGAWERQELQANVFARELLLPRDVAKQLWREGKRSRDIAGQLQLPLELVRQQLADSLLLPDVPIPPPTQAPDPSPAQRTAAEAREHYTNVVAGPGTGKTTTLVHRITHLINEGVPANKILVLTFTTKAAQELVERLRIANVRSAAQVWAGTFHALGLEFLRKYHQLFGLTPQIKVADQLQQVRLLIKELPKIDLKYYLRLQNPYDWVPGVLKIISRLKEELVTPERYAEILAGLDPAAEDIALERQDIETLYRAYEQVLRREGWVDYTDLLVLLTRQAETDRDSIAQYVDQFDHILVDEYQDVTYVMVELVKRLGSATRKLWVVGDVRQAVHHWRGASIQSLIKFEEAFARKDETASIQRYTLDINRRSTPEILRVVELAGRYHQLEQKIPLVSVQPSRAASNQAPVRYLCDSSDSQTLSIAQAISSAISKGTLYRQHCVISATNAQVDQLSVDLAQLGIPTLHIGDLFQRPEVRRFLCLMHLISQRSPTALIGLQENPELGMPVADIDHLVSLSKKGTQWQRGRWIGKPAEGLSAEGAQTSRNLANLLKGMKWHTRPWDFICDLLFEQGFGIPDLDDESTARQIDRLAVWLFLYGVRNGDGAANQATISQFLIREDLRRRIEHRPERALPPEASAINAVRLMTIHGSKGLEFSVVHLANVDNGRFGIQGSTDFFKARKELLLPPEALNSTQEDRVYEEAVERNNLLYVALSRAKDHLNIYTTAEEPELPATVRDRAAVVLRKGVQASSARNASTVRASGSLAFQVITYAAVDSFMDCPLQFHYAHELHLPAEQEIDVSARARTALMDALERVFRDGCAPDGAFIDVWTEKRLPDSANDPNLVEEAFAAFNRGIGIQRSHGARYIAPQQAKIGNIHIELPWMLEGQSGTMHWLRTGTNLYRLSKDVRPLMLNLGGKRCNALSLHSITSGKQEDCVPSKAPGSTTLVKAVNSLCSGQRSPMQGKQCNRCAYRAICTKNL